MLDSTARRKLIKWKNECREVHCPICDKIIYADDEDIEYVKTKRGGEYFIHTDCVTKWGE